MQHQPFLYEWATMLLTRSSPGDADHASGLAAAALAGAEELGMTAVAAGARSILSR